jgi:hypothetical protein
LLYLGVLARAGADLGYRTQCVDVACGERRRTGAEDGGHCRHDHNRATEEAETLHGWTSETSEG